MLLLKKVKSLEWTIGWGQECEIDAWQTGFEIHLPGNRVEVWDSFLDEPNLLIACSENMFSELLKRGYIKQ